MLAFVATDAGVTSKSGPAPVPFGQTQAGTDGRSVTVHALDPNRGPPGLESAVVGVDAEVCAGPSPVWVRASDFRLSTAGYGFEWWPVTSNAPVATPGGSTVVLPNRYPDGTRVFPDLTELSPGECVRGWVNFIPATPPTKGAILRFTNPNAGDGNWRWP